MASPNKFQKIEEVLNQSLSPDQIAAIDQLDRVQVEIKLIDDEEESSLSHDDIRGVAKMLQRDSRIKKRKQTHYAERDEIIEKIPNFWGMAIWNESYILGDLPDRDKDALKYLTKINVEEFDDPKIGFKISFHFSENPYFENSVLIKEFEMKESTGDEPVGQGTTINWKPEKDLTKKPPAPETGKKRSHDQTKKESFFSYFSNGVEHEENEFDMFYFIANVIWDNPLESYLGNDSLGSDDAGERGGVSGDNSESKGDDGDDDDSMNQKNVTVPEEQKQEEEEKEEGGDEEEGEGERTPWERELETWGPDDPPILPPRRRCQCCAGTYLGTDWKQCSAKRHIICVYCQQADDVTGEFDCPLCDDSDDEAEESKCLCS